MHDAQELDCRRCGACCCNSRENRAEGFEAYVDVEPGARLLRKPDLLRRVAVQRAGGWHLRLQPDGRCASLKGRLGERVRCQIYALRPKACRRVESGDEDCLRARRERGLD